MNDIRPIISKNLATLRKEKNLTQFELAEKLNYSDKAISRWENGETLPSINVLYELCSFYGITLNDLADESFSYEDKKIRSRNSLSYRIWLCITSGAFVWLVATVYFFYAITLLSKVEWTVFIWALPFSIIAVRLTEKGWFNNLAKFVLNTVTAWTFLLAIFLQMLKSNFWPIFLIGIPVELIIFLAYKLKQYK